MDWIDWVILPVIGAAGGFLAGLLGVGGGIIFIPVLTYYFSKMGMGSAEIVKYTLANSIFLVFVSGLSGIYKQKKMGNWDWQRALKVGIPGAMASLLLSYSIKTGSWYHKTDFQLVFLGFLLLSMANMIFSKQQKEEIDSEQVQKKSGLDILVGVLAGTVVALSGLGGGVIMVPLFRVLLKMPMRESSRLSLSVIPILSLAPLLNYLINTQANSEYVALQTGFIAWQFAFPIAVGVAIFAGIGIKTAKRISVLYLRIIFALLSAIIFIKTIYDLYHQ